MTVVAAFGDTAPPVQGVIVEAIRDLDPDAVVFLGDAVDVHGRLARRNRMTRWARDMAPLSGRLHSVIGNHDYERDGSASRYMRALDALGAPQTSRFSLRLPGLHLVGISSPHGAHSVTADDLMWCSKEFAADVHSVVRVVAIHEPLFPVAGRIGLSLDSHTEARDAFLGYLQSWGVSLVLCGHEHMYARRSLTADLVQLISGGGVDRLNQRSTRTATRTLWDSISRR